ncbi:MAG TPA: sigma-70 family RNA polymerase sigma factor [Thermoguttaceae bacterium]|nr:sigma-70 family RNA polymerase sigma factor [Thermoguttaceae bacterium]
MSGDDASDRGRWIRSVVDRYEGQLVRYAARITGDVERGRDVVQDAFLRLCREDRAQVDGHLAEWLFTVCRNRALDVKRKEKRMQSLPVDQAVKQPSGEPDQAIAAEVRDTADHVRRLLETLPENQQEVLRLKFQAGLSYREISRVTELSVSNVGYLIHTAIRKLRDKLQADPETADS